jgi:small subunit ribosomal protein S6
LKTVAKRLYEAMFLVDSNLAASDWDGVLATIKNILSRAQAEIVSLKKWGERRLAYEVNHKSKGTYVLCYFRADGYRIPDIERNVRLSERIMRVLIVNAENRAIENIEKDTPAVQAKKHKDKVKQVEQNTEVLGTPDGEQQQAPDNEAEQKEAKQEKTEQEEAKLADENTEDK